MNMYMCIRIRIYVPVCMGAYTQICACVTISISVYIFEKIFAFLFSIHT